MRCRSYLPASPSIPGDARAVTVSDPVLIRPDYSACDSLLIENSIAPCDEENPDDPQGYGVRPCHCTPWGPWRHVYERGFGV
jgi:hypothetical protein